MTYTLHKYRIQAFSELTGVPVSTLRAWERRYGLPKPSRTQMAYRLYCDEDVAQIREMVALTERGIAPAEAAKAILQQDSKSPSPALPSAGDEFEPLRQRLLDDVVSGDSQAATRTTAYALAITSPAQAFDHVFAPVLRDVGERWERGDMTVAQEHMLASVIASAISRVAALVRPQMASGHVILACVEDELHAIGLYGLELHLSNLGVRTTILGQRSSPQTIADAVGTMEPDAVGLSLSIAPATSPTKLFRAYADACGDMPWIVGGALADRYAKTITACGGVVSTGSGSLAAHQLAELARRRKGG